MKESPLQRYWSRKDRLGPSPKDSGPFFKSVQSVMLGVALGAVAIALLGTVIGNQR